MQNKRLLFVRIFACIITISLAQKKIYFTKVQCIEKSNKMGTAKCFSEDNSTFTFQYTTANIEVVSLLALSNINLYIHGSKNVMRLNGMRLDMCTIWNTASRPTLVALLQKGMQMTDNNWPRKCPFQLNTTYILRHIKFDANYLPSYLPEYNYTFTGKFKANNENTLEMRVAGSFCNINNDCTGAQSSRS